MSMRPNPDLPTEALLRSANAGGKEARELLIARACTRLRSLTRRMLRCDFPGLRRWEDTNDVLQSAMLRLCRALDNVQPESTKHFYCLAAQQIRRELIDLARHHFGPHGLAANHESEMFPRNGGWLNNFSNEHIKPESLAEWTEFHELVNGLPEDERAVFDLVWYQQLGQQEAADILGVSLRTLKRRWQSAKVLLYDAMSGHRPG
jgi:RNA polymerase sigma factor (sigma-70 family)